MGLSRKQVHLRGMKSAGIDGVYQSRDDLLDVIDEDVAAEEAALANPSICAMLAALHRHLHRDDAGEFVMRQPRRGDKGLIKELMALARQAARDEAAADAAEQAIDTARGGPQG